MRRTSFPSATRWLGEHFYFVIDEKPKRTRTGLKRLRNIAANPQVALVIDDYDEDWTRLAYLLVQGEAALVADREEYAGALAALRAALPAVPRHAAGVRYAPDGAHHAGAQPSVACGVTSSLVSLNETQGNLNLAHRRKAAREHLSDGMVGAPDISQAMKVRWADGGAL